MLIIIIIYKLMERQLQQNAGYKTWRFLLIEL